MLLDILIRVHPSSLSARDTHTSQTSAGIKIIEIVDAVETPPLTRTFASNTVKRIGSNEFVRNSSSIVDYPGPTGEITQWTSLRPSGMTLIFREHTGVNSGFTPR